DVARWLRQPCPAGDLPDPVAGMLVRLARGPAGKEADPAGLDRAPGAHPPVMEAEEVDPSASLSSVRCTIRVLASFSSRPSPPSTAVSRASAASACCRVPHITTRSSQ